MSKFVPSEGVVYYVNPVVGGMSFYLSYELEPGKKYRVETTSDAINYRTLYELTVPTGLHGDFYLTYNVGQPTDPWPRVVELE